MKCPFGSLIEVWHSLLIQGAVTRIQQQRFLGCIDAHVSEGCNGDCEYVLNTYLLPLSNIREELPRSPASCGGIV